MPETPEDILANLETHHHRRQIIHRPTEIRIDYTSNDYLGLSTHTDVIQASSATARDYGVSSSASPLISGYSELHHQLEFDIANLKGSDAALIFNSGYQANIGVIQAIQTMKPLFLVDRLAHASIFDGLRTAEARFKRFHHNDYDHLETLISASDTPVWVITESVFSMDGDRCDMTALAALKQRFSIHILLDEAHATGVCGTQGRGLSVDYPNVADVVVGTFSKALGSFGAFVCCSSVLRELMVNQSRSLIYSTALPPPVIAASIASLNQLKTHPNRGQQLLENSAHFRSQLIDKGFDCGLSNSQIVPILVPGNEHVIRTEQQLINRGIWAKAIRSPTVPKGSERLRFAVCIHHTPSDLADTVDTLVAI